MEALAMTEEMERLREADYDLDRLPVEDAEQIAARFRRAGIQLWRPGCCWPSRTDDRERSASWR